MSRIHDVAHAERITREAAQALGIDLQHAQWNRMIGGLTLKAHALGIKGERKTFAPLNVAADAYEVESRLMLNAQYVANGTGWLLQMTAQGGLGAMFEVLHEGDDRMRARMELATIMGALHTITTGAPARRASDHG